MNIISLFPVIASVTISTGFEEAFVPPKIYLPSKFVFIIWASSSTLSFISSAIAFLSSEPYAAFPEDTNNSLILCIVLVAWYKAWSVESNQFIVSFIFSLYCLFVLISVLSCILLAVLYGLSDGLLISLPVLNWRFNVCILVKFLFIFLK